MSRHGEPQSSSCAIVIERGRAVILPTLDPLEDGVLNGRSDPVAALFRRGDVITDISQAFLTMKPDVAVVFGSTNDTVAICAAAVEAGAHVLIVPPFAIAPPAASNLAQRAARRGVEIGFAMNQLLGRARRLLEGGRIGEPLLFNSGLFIESSEWAGLNGAATPHDAALQKGILEVAHLLQDDIAAFASVGVGADTGISCLLRMNTGIEGVLHVAAGREPATGERLELYGTKGMLMVRRAGPVAGRATLTSAHVDIEELLANPTDPDKLKRRFAPLEPDGEDLNLKDLAEDLIRNGTATPRLRNLLHAHHGAQVIAKGSGTKGWTSIQYESLPQGELHA